MTKQTGIVVSQLLGSYQLAVGIVGLIFFLYSAYLNSAVNLFLLLYCLIMIGMLVFCAYTGYKCLTDVAFGLQLTFYNQLLQFPWFTLLGFQYSYSAGLGLYVGVSIAEGPELVNMFRWFAIGMGKANPEVKLFAINIIPIAITFLLEPLSKALKKDD
jgi:hypothetical protein